MLLTAGSLVPTIVSLPYFKIVVGRDQDYVLAFICSYTSCGMKLHKNCMNHEPEMADRNRSKFWVKMGTISKTIPKSDKFEKNKNPLESIRGKFSRSEKET